MRWSRSSQAQGFAVESRLAMGDPATEIIKAAEAEGADLVAMATHGHRFVKDILLGATVNKVRHELKVPVLLLQAPGSRALRRSGEEPRRDCAGYASGRAPRRAAASLRASRSSPGRATLPAAGRCSRPAGRCRRAWARADPRRHRARSSSDAGSSPSRRRPPERQPSGAARRASSLRLSVRSFSSSSPCRACLPCLTPRPRVRVAAPSGRRNDEYSLIIPRRLGGACASPCGSAQPELRDACIRMNP